MSKRGWLLGLAGLILTGFLIACGSTYNSSSNGLLLVGSQGSGVIETFAFSLNDGHISAIANSPNDTANKVCMLGSLPASMVVDPAGQYAYAILEENRTYCGTNSQTGIATFQLKSDGNVTQVGSLMTLQSGTIIEANVTPPDNTESVPVVPSMITVDTAGKFLFVANRATSDSAGRYVPGSVSVLSIGSGGALTELAGSPFFAVAPAMTVPQASYDFISVAPTPTVFPQIGINGTQNSVCSTPGTTPPTSEYLYAVDQLGNRVFEFQVDTSSGALTPVTTTNGLTTFPTDQLPVGIAVDPCDRFAYVSNNLNSKVSAYTICSAVLPPTCPVADGSLVPVPGSPFVMSGNANGAGPIAVDPYGNYVYVVGTQSNTVSGFKISPVTGALVALNPAVVQTGLRPTAMAIRKDDNWMFISNFDGNTVSQYSITPGSGALTAEAPIQTDNNPWGVAVK